MSKQTINNKEKGLIVRNKINDNFTEVYTSISNIGNLSPSGTPATLAELQATYPTGTTGIYVVVADGHWYYWNGSAWTDGGVYQATGIGAMSIGFAFLTQDVLLEIGKTISQAYVNIIGQYYNISGILSSSVSYNSTEKIDCKQGDLFRHYGALSGSSAYRYVIFDSNDNVLYVGVAGNGTQDIIETLVPITQSTASKVAFSYLVSQEFVLEKYISKDLESTVNTISSSIDDINTNISLDKYYRIDAKANPNSKIQIRFNFAISGLEESEKLSYSTINSDVNISGIGALVFVSNDEIATGTPVFQDSSNALPDYEREFTIPSGYQFLNIFIDIYLTDPLLESHIDIYNLKLLNYTNINYYNLYNPNINDLLEYNTITDYATKEMINNIEENYATVENLTTVSNNVVDIISWNPLYGKKLGGLGDSLMSSTYSGAGNEWLSLVGSRNNMTVYNYAISGNPISTDVNCMAVRYVDMVDDLDYIIVMGGANDLNRNAPIGTDLDNTIATYKGALNILIQGLITKYPRGKIVFCTNYSRYAGDEPYVNAMQEMCAIYSIPCHDNFRKSGVHFDDLNWMAIYGANSEDLGNKHLNAEGDIRVSTMYEALLKSL